MTPIGSPAKRCLTAQRGRRSHRRGRTPASLALAVFGAAFLSQGCSTQAGSPMAAASPELSPLYAGGLDLSARAGMGGVSGLHLSEDGSYLTAVTDDGRLIAGPLRHTSRGNLADWSVEQIAPLPGIGGGKAESDAEALARATDGAWLVALERRHRILRYAHGDSAPQGEPEEVSIPEGITRLPANKGIEALTVRADGVWVAFAEAAETDDGQHRVYVRQDGKWSEKRYRTDPFYAPSDAAALPNGDVLVLDRGYSLIGGVRARVKHITSEDLLSKELLEGTLLGDVEPPLGVDNFEGLAVHQSASGEFSLYLVSDDNFSPLQRTLLVKYTFRLPAPE